MRIKIDSELVLKKFEPADANELFSLLDANRKALRQWLPFVDGTKSSEDSLEFIRSTQKSYDSHQSLQCGVWYQGRLAGAIGHHRIFWLNKWTSIGYWLGEEFYGKGTMTKAVKGLLKHSFEDLQLNCVEIAAAVENKKSRAIPERLGFKEEGVLRQREWLYDRFVDHAVYSILSSEWRRQTIPGE